MKGEALESCNLGMRARRRGRARLPSSSIVRILKSIPIVVMKDDVKESSAKRSRRQDLPTPAGGAETSRGKLVPATNDTRREEGREGKGGCDRRLLCSKRRPQVRSA